MAHPSAVRVAVVTGSNKGIGFAIVRGLCKKFEGHVFLTSRDIKRGKEAVQELEREGLHPKFHQLDITSEESISSLKKFMLETYGGVDILVNNAGIAYKTSSTAPDMEQATVTLEVNFTGTLNMMRAFVPIINPHGRIVNVSSFAGTLSRLSKQELRDEFSNPSLSEVQLVAMMDKFIVDVSNEEHVEKGWSKSFYSNTKVGMTALTKVFARNVAESGEGFTCVCRRISVVMMNDMWLVGRKGIYQLNRVLMSGFTLF